MISELSFSNIIKKVKYFIYPPKDIFVEIEYECHHDLERRHQTEMKWTNRKRFKHAPKQNKSLKIILPTFVSTLTGNTPHELHRINLASRMGYQKECPGLSQRGLTDQFA
jgi:hypothetical protein